MNELFPRNYRARSKKYLRPISSPPCFNSFHSYIRKDPIQELFQSHGKIKILIKVLSQNNVSTIRTPLSLNEWNELCKEYIYIYLRRSSKFNWINYSRKKKGKKFLSNKIHPSAVHEPLSNTSPNVANLGHSPVHQRRRNDLIEMRRTKLTFTTSRPDEASPLVKYPFSWRASSFAGARQMGYYLRKVLFQSQGVIRISSAGRASSTRGGRKMKRKRRREEEEDGPTNETTNRTSSLLCQKTFLSFSHSTYEHIPSHEEDDDPPL